MSWVAHDIEPYIFQRKLAKSPVAISFAALVIGSWGPDIVTKWFVHGLNIAGLHFKADDPVRFHRGWPGVGFTHSLAFGVVVAGIIYLSTKSKAWALGFMLGHWAHCLSDLGDSVGVMLLFPFTTHIYALGAWANADASSRVSDAAAYYSGLGGIWDAFWLTLMALSWPLLRRGYFLERVAPRDGFWAWLGKRRSEDFLLAVYRGTFFFGACRFTAWMLWSHVLHHYPFDPTWGGPHWAHAAHLHQ
jgi:membrane-bound metal-dependent hydrolase YbcI (DUF457 family)